MESVEVFSLYSNLSEPEVWKFWEDQIKLAVATAYVRARETAASAPLFPLEIVGELSVTIRQGETVTRVDLPSPPPPVEPPPAQLPRQWNRKQYDLPPPPSWVKLENGDFTLWFGQHKGKNLCSLLTQEGLKYCHWLRYQEALPIEYRKAITNHIAAAVSAENLPDQARIGGCHNPLNSLK